MPSSHASFGPPGMPSPQTLSLQSFLHASSSSTFSSSHCSPATLLILPSPQAVAVQSMLQSAVSPKFSAGSQPSTRVPDVCWMPSPQWLRLHVFVQSSWLSVLPSSHSSSALPLPSLSIAPSPQPVPPWQSSLQPPGAPLSSHFSLMSTMPLPHTSVERQLPEQPSPGIVLPSSHASPTSRISLPHTSTDLQSAAQPSPPSALPSSH